MSNLTIRMDVQEKEALAAWAAVRGKTVTDYIKQLVADDMASGSAEDRVAAWFRENNTALQAEAEVIDDKGIPGSHLALNYPRPDAKV